MVQQSATRKWPACVLAAILLISIPSLASAGEIARYWGQKTNEGRLSSVCKSGNYNIVLISFLSRFGLGKSPELNLAGHCNPSAGDCTEFENDVKTCQDSGVKVLLSLGGGVEGYGFKSADEAKRLANHIWHNYLGGNSGTRPLGKVKLDGIDLDIEVGRGDYYVDLGRRLRDIVKEKGYSKRLFLSAAPQCPFPDKRLGLPGQFLRAGLADYVFVQFYNNPDCDFRKGADAMVNAWKKWAAEMPMNTRIFLGIPESTAIPGFISSSTLNTAVLPRIKKIGKYGGVMLWPDNSDTGYASAIKGAV